MASETTESAYLEAIRGLLKTALSLNDSTCYVVESPLASVVREMT